MQYLNNKNMQVMSDTAISDYIGTYVRENRLNQNITQSDLANKAGINRSTLNLFECGKKDIQLLTLIRILRALNALHLLEVFTFEKPISPMMIAQEEHKKYLRAHKKRNKL
jgi:transcriptional regulator with XRE-family HTH domain